MNSKSTQFAGERPQRPCVRPQIENIARIRPNFARIDRAIARIHPNFARILKVFL